MKVGYISVPRSVFDRGNYRLEHTDKNRYRLKDYYTDYWTCYVDYTDGENVELGIETDTDSIKTIIDTILSEIHINDTYISICEKIERLCGYSKWSIKKDLGQRKNEIPFDFVTTEKNMELLEAIFVEQDKGRCYDRFQELIKDINLHR